MRSMPSFHLSNLLRVSSGLEVVDASSSLSGLKGASPKPDPESLPTHYGRSTNSGGGVSTPSAAFMNGPLFATLAFAPIGAGDVALMGAAYHSGYGHSEPNPARISGRRRATADIASKGGCGFLSPVAALTNDSLFAALAFATIGVGDDAPSSSVLSGSYGPIGRNAAQYCDQGPVAADIDFNRGHGTKMPIGCSSGFGLFEPKPTSPGTHS